MRRSTAVLLLLSAPLMNCGGCQKSTQLADEGLRLWGRRKVAEAVKARANARIDPFVLDADAETRQRVLTMSFDEVVARFGFLRLEGTATFDLSRNGHRIGIHEQTVVEHGLHGSFRVVQKDKDGDVTREMIFNNGVFYIRNGERAKMRVQGIIDDSHLALREEAWAPLKTFTGYFGPRLGLKKAGASRVAKRGAARYKFVLVEGPSLIEVPGTKGKKKPVALSGNLYVDEKTGVPTKVKLRAELSIPGAEDTEPGVLKLFLDLTITPIKGQEIKPESFVPTIAHRPVDLEPLRFLEEDTRTSTVIGGGE